MKAQVALVVLVTASAACHGCGNDGDEAEPSASPSSAPPPTSAPSASPSASADAGAVEDTRHYENEALPEPDRMASTLEEQREAMLRRMRALGVLDAKQAAATKAIIDEARWLGQGNPKAVKHPLTRSECMARRKAAGAREELKPQCGAPYMTPIYNPAVEAEKDATVCIDRYEYPGLPCDYPVTWVTTAVAQKLCKAQGKRLCDAHEWEGACAGALLPAEQEYAFGRPRITMRGMHNLDREIRWAYGPDKDHTKCGTGSLKSENCETISWKECGSNTYPAGSFPACRSPFGVYDQHGNAAEHMALPMTLEQLGRDGGFGEPEMKGSWFVFQVQEAHEDDCRWRAPPWHDNEGKNHYNYHLGFRCCKDLSAPAKKG
jgi:formylglycine-generating enzyme required for sulfatase activity